MELRCFQTGQEELVSSTAYYHLCLDTITEAPLIQAFLKFLIVEESQENKKVIDIVIERISIGNRVRRCAVLPFLWMRKESF